MHVFGDSWTNVFTGVNREHNDFVHCKYFCMKINSTCILTQLALYRLPVMVERTSIFIIGIIILTLCYRKAYFKIFVKIFQTKL